MLFTWSYIQQTLTRKCHFFINFMEIDLWDEFKRNSTLPQGQRFAKIVKEVKAVFSILSFLSLHPLFMFLVFYYGIQPAVMQYPQLLNKLSPHSDTMLSIPYLW